MAPPRPPPACAPLVVFLVFWCIYNANLRTIAMGDSYSTRFVPFSILRSGKVTLEDFRGPILDGRQDAYWLRELPDGRAASTYPLVTPVAVVPLYLPAAVSLAAHDWPAERLLPAARVAEKASASALAALGAAMLYAFLRRRTTSGLAFWLTAAYGLGTGTWPISSQALWQHALAQVLVIAALHLAGSERRRGPWELGIVLGLLVANRLPDLPLALGFLGAELRRRWPDVLPVGLGTLAGGLPFLVCNLLLFGSPIGGYAAFSHTPAALGRFQGFDAPLAMLASPGKGLLVFSPFLLLLAARRRTAEGRAVPASLEPWLFAGIAAQVLLYSFTDWDGGSCYGPRFLLDCVPILVVALAPALSRRDRMPRLLFAIALSLSVAIQFIGAFKYSGVSNRPLRVHRPVPIARDPLWRLDLAPILVEGRQPLAPFTLLDDLRRAFGNGDPLHGTAEPGASGPDSGRGRSNRCLRPMVPAAVHLWGYLRTESGVGENARALLAALDEVRVPMVPIDLPDSRSRRDPSQPVSY